MKIEKAILAVITTSPENVSGGAPIFTVKDAEDIQKKAVLFEAILDGIAHEVDESTYVVVKH